MPTLEMVQGSGVLYRKGSARRLPDEPDALQLFAWNSIRICTMGFQARRWTALESHPTSQLRMTHAKKLVSEERDIVGVFPLGASGWHSPWSIRQRFLQNARRPAALAT